MYLDLNLNWYHGSFQMKFTETETEVDIDFLQLIDLFSKQLGSYWDLAGLL